MVNSVNSVGGELMSRFPTSKMRNDKLVEKSCLGGRNYLLVDLELLQKEELDQRRKLRIQQVRLQSKDLASRVLQDVRNERKLQVKMVQNQQADVFKKWQSRKLHEINLKYKENICAGQRAAAELPDPEEEILQQVIKNSEAAQGRGRKAFSQLRAEKEIAQLQKEKLAFQREKIKALETIRSAMVSSLPNTKSISRPEQNSLGPGEKAGCSSDRNEVQMMGMEEEPGEGSVNPVVPNLCLEDTPLEKRVRKEPASSSKKAAPTPKVPPPSMEVYDHHNPCSITQRLPPTVRVERTSPLSQTNAIEAAEMEEKEETERQAVGIDNEVWIKRGKKALAKELVRRDFDHVMTRLDELAREERKARATEHPKLPPEVYMNEERTAMKIWKQQQDLESAFESVCHGNMGLKPGKDPLQAKRACPLVVEVATFPEKLKPDLKDQVAKASLPKLNVGVCDHGSTSSSSGYEAEASTSSSHSALSVGGEEPDRMEHSTAVIDLKPSEKSPVEEMAPKSLERANGDDCVERAELQRRIEIARSLLEEKDGENTVKGGDQKPADEGDHGPLNKDNTGAAAWWCSFSSGRVAAPPVPLESIIEGNEEKPEQNKCKAKRKASIYKRSFEVKGKTLEELDLLVRKGKKDEAILDTDASLSSISSSSWRLEEVHVVVKVEDQSSSERESKDKDQRLIVRSDEIHGKSPGKSKGEKKRRKAGVRLEEKPKELEDKPRSRQDAPIAKVPGERVMKGTKETHEVGSQATLGGRDVTLKEDKKRRERKEAKKKRLGVQPPLSDASCVSLHSHQELSESDHAKALLDEIRCQRRRLEKWLGRKEGGKGNAQLRDYIQRLLCMTRESVADLSVSEVSSPVLPQSTPLKRDTSPTLDIVEVPPVQKTFEDKGVGTSFSNEVVNEETLSPLPRVVEEEAMSVSPRSEEFNADAPDLGVRKSLEEMKLRVKSPQFVPSMFPKEPPRPVVSIPESHLKPPSPPPPSPEYDELSILHSKRISLLGARLTEIREMQKKLLTSSHSSSSESDSSQSLSTTSGDEEESNLSRKSPSSKESVPVSDGGKKSWQALLEESDDAETLESLHASAVDDQDSEDSLLEKLVQESLQISEPKKSFKPSEEVRASQKSGTTKAGPPPTAMKGGIWIGSDFQIPHELSTIVEVDSKLLSTTSLTEQKKEKEMTTPVSDTKHQPGLLEEPIMIPEGIKPLQARSILLELGATEAASGLATEDQRASASLMAEKTVLNMEVILPNAMDFQTAEHPEPQDADEEGEKSDSSLPLSFSTLDDSTELPENLDDALRILGISPTVLKRKKSPLSRDTSPARSSHSDSSAEESLKVSKPIQASPIERDTSLRLPNVELVTGVKIHDPEVNKGEADLEQRTSWLHFTPLGSLKDLSVGASSSKSEEVKSVSREGIVKEVGLEESVLQSSPCGSFGDFTFGSGSSSTSEPMAKVKDDLLRAALWNLGARLPSQESMLKGKKLSPELEQSDQGSPIIPKETPQSTLKHSTPLHSFSSEGSSSNSEERRKSRSCFPFLGDSAPSSISGGNASEGADWRNIGDEDEDLMQERKGN